MAMAAKAHTVVLVQYNTQQSSRTYLDFEDLLPALDGRPPPAPARTIQPPAGPP